MDDDLARRFRDALAGVCTPVCVISATDDERPHGTTVSAFASLSMNPPMVALDRASDLLAVIARSRRLGVNILAHDQHVLALIFARKGTDKFAGTSWTWCAALPRLHGVAGWLACEVTDIVPGGDHLVALCQVIEADCIPSMPLTYHSRAFGTHVPLPV
jgi:flavin reductase (DIM6/NTAB) family NADH-FMN oxidoreductase RutF